MLEIMLEIMLESKLEIEFERNLYWSPPCAKMK